MSDCRDELEVLYEDNHLLAVNKPAMLPTMGVEEGRESLLTVAKEYVRQAYQKPGNVYLGIVSRLDAPVTGLVLIARTSKAAARLSESFRSRDVHKVYLAAVQGTPPAATGTLEHFLRKDERHRKVHVTQAGAEGAQAARLHYRVMGSASGLTLLEVELDTGRKHQIRVQLAKIGCPIVGDRKYGATLEFPRGIALHSRQLELEHPVRREPLTLTAPLPASWRRSAPTSKLPLPAKEQGERH
ncbi:MAG: RluA family pseudouridine synthase [Planctomycetaceae bacterium]|nr:RluA family pseudouridine synthase [Planctomycetaceae bacterium]